jgi:hypothetical protein
MPYLANHGLILVAACRRLQNLVSEAQHMLLEKDSLISCVEPTLAG